MFIVAFRHHKRKLRTASSIEVDLFYQCDWNRELLSVWICFKHPSPLSIE